MAEDGMPCENIVVASVRGALGPVSTVNNNLSNQNPKETLSDQP